MMSLRRPARPTPISRRCGARCAHSMRLAYRAEPKLLVISFVLVTAVVAARRARSRCGSSSSPTACIDERPALAGRVAGVRPRARPRAAGWLLRTDRRPHRDVFRDRATIEIEAHVAHLQASVASIEHHERPAYLDRLQLLREQVFLLNHLYGSLMSSIGSVGRLVITVGAARVDPPGARAARPCSRCRRSSCRRWRAAVERRAEEHAAPGMPAGPPPVRHRDPGRSRQGDPGRRHRRRRRRRGGAPRGRTWYERGRRRPMGERGLARGGVDGVRARVRRRGRVRGVGARRVGRATSCSRSPPAPNLSRYLGVTVGQAEFLRWTIDAAQRLVWLEDYAAQHRDRADSRCPTASRDGIRLEHVSFRYPGTDKVVLDDVDLELRGRLGGRAGRARTARARPRS